LRGGSDIALEASQVVLMSGKLADLCQAIKLSRATLRTIRQNLAVSFFYNLLGIPIAAGVLFPMWQIRLNPAIAGAAMALSSISVLANSLRLRRYSP
jgi:Cu+-exporting ATPase